MIDSDEDKFFRENSSPHPHRKMPSTATCRVRHIREMGSRRKELLLVIAARSRLAMHTKRVVKLVCRCYRILAQGPPYVDGHAMRGNARMSPSGVHALRCPETPSIYSGPHPGLPYSTEALATVGCYSHRGHRIFQSLRWQPKPIYERLFTFCPCDLRDEPRTMILNSLIQLDSHPSFDGERSNQGAPLLHP